MTDPNDPKYQGLDSGSLNYLASHPQAPRPPPDVQLHGDVDTARFRDVWTVLCIWRTLNATTLATFFQPDEYYQALEPAWQLAFGAASGAWITWEWPNQLRSSLHPIVLAGIYKAVDFFCYLLFPPVLRTKLLVLIPKVMMGLSAALQDYYIWGLAERVYGSGSKEAAAALGLTVLSPWQWYVSTRALSNSLETTLTVIALYYWPWQWMKPSATPASRNTDVKNLKYCILLAGFASVLRPTNVIIWIVLSLLTLPYANQQEFLAMVRDASIYGSVVLGVANGCDRLFYGVWTFPAANFLRFNLTEKLAVFYGKNRTEYYLAEGLPILLTTYLYFGVTGVVQALTGRFPIIQGLRTPPASILRSLAITALALPVILSCISHKEVRFIYPILPPLLVILARPVAAFLDPFPLPSSTIKRLLVGLLLFSNIVLGMYFGFFHGRGVISVTDFLKLEFEYQNYGMGVYGETENLNHTSVGVLMPCHSIPWRSQLVYAEIDAWALTCEPPLGLTEQEKSQYKDEADIFYEDPNMWLEQEFGDDLRPWPQYLLFFGQLERTLKGFFAETAYSECWRGFNSLFHDDWRRKGDVVVWCISEELGGRARLWKKQ